MADNQAGGDLNSWQNGVYKASEGMHPQSQQCAARGGSWQPPARSAAWGMRVSAVDIDLNSLQYVGELRPPVANSRCQAALIGTRHRELHGKNRPQHHTAKPGNDDARAHGPCRMLTLVTPCRNTSSNAMTPQTRLIEHGRPLHRRTSSNMNHSPCEVLPAELRKQPSPSHLPGALLDDHTIPAP